MRCRRPLVLTRSTACASLPDGAGGPSSCNASAENKYDLYGRLDAAWEKGLKNYLGGGTTTKASSDVLFESGELSLDVC